MKTLRRHGCQRTLVLGIALGLGCAALAPTSFAMEEVIAHGAIADRAVDTQRLEAEIAAYIKTVELESKDSVKASLESATAPKLYIALASESHRG